MSKVLLREYYELCEGGVCQDFLTEDEKRQVKEGVIFMTGILQKADTRNGNGRVYPRAVLEREMENYQKLVKEKRALGELDHPEESIINLKNCSHMITQTWWDDDGTVMGKVKVLNTPSGNILKSLVQSGVKLGISSRGLGSVREHQGNTVVEDDFQLICFDFVSEPSTPNAYMSAQTMYEGADPGITKADKINRLLNSITRKE
jgi:hypothetical protein